MIISDDVQDAFPRMEEGSAKTVRSLALSRDVELAVLSIDVFDAVVFMRGGAYMLRYPRLKTRKVGLLSSVCECVSMCECVAVLLFECVIV